jgi:hypothetical protein
MEMFLNYRDLERLVAAQISALGVLFYLFSAILAVVEVVARRLRYTFKCGGVGCGERIGEGRDVIA